MHTPIVIQGRLERTETNLMHIKWEVTWTHGKQPNTFSMGQRVKYSLRWRFDWGRIQQAVITKLEWECFMTSWKPFFFSGSLIVSGILLCEEEVKPSIKLFAKNRSLLRKSHLFFFKKFRQFYFKTITLQKDEYVGSQNCNFHLVTWLTKAGYSPKWL